MEFLKYFATSLIVFLGIDAIWLGVVAKSFYPKHIGHLMSSQPNLPVAFLFYLIFIAGLVYLVVLPNKNEPLYKTLIAAAIFGLCAYSTYDLTNQATLKSWPAIVTIVDMIWGTVVTTAVTAITLLLLKKI